MDVLVVAFTGDDCPGLVHALAEIVSDHEGNWESSHMTALGGVFVGNLVVSAEPDRIDALMEDLRGLDGMLDVCVQRARGLTDVADGHRSLTVEIVGGDHPGIVEEFAAAVARPRVNVRRLDSANVDARSEGGGAAGRNCRVLAELEVGEDVDLTALSEELIALARGMRVEIALDPPLG
ncbi:glycine cleavage system protein R [Mobilicoccus massiliensis]|uniref:glycine cleavage system protein R n=1 Tax=Mobilicoccus massiliensis TaxID=1522310 RepID=UPI001596B8DB|nr:ACT domain-containing protein [Mobilicoccus massiliensis]